MAAISAGISPRLTVPAHSPPAPLPDPHPPALQARIIADIAPLDAQIGVAQPETVPGALRDAIFGDAELPSYALLDAARIPDLAEALARSGLEHLCLFQGRAFQQLQSVAPWLVRLQPGNRFTRALFTRSPAPWHLWDARPGIFLRSHADIAQLRAHLRHFTRLQDEKGTWYYFRFWEPAVAALYFPSLADRPDLARRWFMPRDNAPIARLLAVQPQGESGNGTAHLLTPALTGTETPARGNALLTQRDLALFVASRRQQDADALARDLRDAFADDIALPDDQLRDRCRRAVDRLAGLGFRQRDHLFVMLSWEIFFGPGFESIDPEGRLSQILHTPRDEAERFEMLKQRMQTLG